MTRFTITFFRTAIIIIAPAVMLASFIYHPHIGNPTDPGFLENLAAAVSADTTRWAVAHLMTAAGSGLLMLAFLAIRSHLREAGEEQWSSLGLPFIILGSTLYALLPAMEFAPLTAAVTNADVQAIQLALFTWFVPVLFTSAVIFVIGAACFVIGIVRSGILSTGLTWIVCAALITMALSRFVPLSIVQFYVQGIAGIVALWPMAYLMWNQPKIQPVNKPVSFPAASGI